MKGDTLPMDQDIQNYVPEVTLEKLLGIDKKKIDYLRQQGMPYISLSKTVRVYYLPDLCKYMAGKKVNSE